MALFMFEFFKKFKYRCIFKVRNRVRWTDIDVDEVMIINCLENGFGKRKVKLVMAGHYCKLYTADNFVHRWEQWKNYAVDVDKNTVSARRGEDILWPNMPPRAPHKAEYSTENVVQFPVKNN